MSWLSYVLCVFSIMENEKCLWLFNSVFKNSSADSNLFVTTVIFGVYKAQTFAFELKYDTTVNIQEVQYDWKIKCLVAINIGHFCLCFYIQVHIWCEFRPSFKY